MPWIAYGAQPLHQCSLAQRLSMIHQPQAPVLGNPNQKNLLVTEPIRRLLCPCLIFLVVAQQN